MRISDWSSDLCSSDLRFRAERALAPPLPERQYIASVVALNARCTIEQRAVKGDAIIVGQLEQTGFLDEAVQLYEMARALASGHDPSSLIGAALGGFKPVRSETHTSVFTILMIITYVAF